MSYMSLRLETCDFAIYKDFQLGQVSSLITDRSLPEVEVIKFFITLRERLKKKHFRFCLFKTR